MGRKRPFGGHYQASRDALTTDSGKNLGNRSCEDARKAALVRSQGPPQRTNRSHTVSNVRLRRGLHRVEIELGLASATKGWNRDKPNAIKDLASRRLLGDRGNERKDSVRREHSRTPRKAQAFMSIGLTIGLLPISGISLSFIRGNFSCDQFSNDRLYLKS